MKYLLLILLTLSSVALADTVEVDETHAEKIKRLRKEYQNRKSVVINYNDKVVKSGDIVFGVEYDR